VELPLWRTRQEAFELLVLDGLRPLLDRWAAELGDVDLVVEDVPPEPVPPAGLVADETTVGRVALARALRGEPGRPGLIVVYRRPVELRAEDDSELRELVHEVLVDAVAELLGKDPEDVDPDLT
jgi:predicted Zn-dependent protease with MMP-like domain